MTKLASFSDPKSVIQRSPLSGVFATSDLVGDKGEFVRRVLSNWYNYPGNSIPVESERHEEAAESLYGFYLKYRQVRDSTLQERGFGAVLFTLYRTGSIQAAESMLAAVQAKMQNAA